MLVKDKIFTPIKSLLLCLFLIACNNNLVLGALGRSKDSVEYKVLRNSESLSHIASLGGSSAAALSVMFSASNVIHDNKFGFINAVFSGYKSGGDIWVSALVNNLEMKDISSKSNYKYGINNHDFGTLIGIEKFNSALFLKGCAIGRSKTSSKSSGELNQAYGEHHNNLAAVYIMLNRSNTTLKASLVGNYQESEIYSYNSNIDYAYAKYDSFIGLSRLAMTHRVFIHRDFAFEPSYSVDYIFAHSAQYNVVMSQGASAKITPKNVSAVRVPLKFSFLAMHNRESFSIHHALFVGYDVARDCFSLYEHVDLSILKASNIESMIFKGNILSGGIDLSFINKHTSIDCNVSLAKRSDYIRKVGSVKVMFKF